MRCLPRFRVSYCFSSSWDAIFGHSEFRWDRSSRTSERSSRERCKGESCANRLPLLGRSSDDTLECGTSDSENPRPRQSLPSLSTTPFVRLPLRSERFLVESRVDFVGQGFETFRIGLSSTTGADLTLGTSSVEATALAGFMLADVASVAGVRVRTIRLESRKRSAVRSTGQPDLETPTELDVLKCLLVPEPIAPPPQFSNFRAGADMAFCSAVAAPIGGCLRMPRPIGLLGAPGAEKNAGGRITSCGFCSAIAG